MRIPWNVLRCVQSTPQVNFCFCAINKQVTTGVTVAIFQSESKKKSDIICAPMRGKLENHSLTPECDPLANVIRISSRAVCAVTAGSALRVVIVRLPCRVMAARVWLRSDRLCCSLWGRPVALWLRYLPGTRKICG